MNKSAIVPFAFGAAFAALLCLARRLHPEPVNDAPFQKQLRRIHEDLSVQRRLSVHTQQVLNDAHRLIHSVSKTLEKHPS